jgi:hypothetical protein
LPLCDQRVAGVRRQSTDLQQHQIFPAMDLNLSPKWEVNFGPGAGVTRSTDHLIAKMILGSRFDF